MAHETLLAVKWRRGGQRCTTGKYACPAVLAL